MVPPLCESVRVITQWRVCESSIGSWGRSKSFIVPSGVINKFRTKFPWVVQPMSEIVNYAKLMVVRGGNCIGITRHKAV